MIKSTDYGDDDNLYPESTWDVDVDNADEDDDLATHTDDPWAFGNNAQYPVLKGIDVNQDGTLDETDLALQHAAFAPIFLQPSYTFESPPVPDMVVNTIRASAAAAPLTYEITDQLLNSTTNPSEFLI